MPSFLIKINIFRASMCKTAISNNFVLAAQARILLERDFYSIQTCVEVT
ncbi:hypothetical protein Aeqsu_0409 [Aequorivita sublithincola DSM 14238]|uniref:Uncharacterized protein n=1 Tax=Aequorivita sublithincola (strain DSM 14238 / LMG 21431 / ACAM 643 / 9-3) TaxID=746697 RepID=I3YSF4_AEQSU|nr:hypothetical protein Aeqsu_0409 [Aequorivita sublithincola DSM 14238]